MRKILHLLTRPEDSLAQVLIAAQTRLPDVTVETVDLTQPDMDYTVVVKKVFEADSLQVW